MRDEQINRVWRRLWRAFLRAGGEVKDGDAVERFRRLVEDYVNLALPPSLSLAMVRVLASHDEPDYIRLARDLGTAEGHSVSATAARQRVSRAVRQLEQAICRAQWRAAAAPERIAIIFKPARTLRTTSASMRRAVQHLHRDRRAVARSRGPL